MLYFNYVRFLSFLIMPFNVAFVFKYHLFCNYFLFILVSCLLLILFLYYMFEPIFGGHFGSPNFSSSEPAWSIFLHAASDSRMAFLLCMDKLLSSQAACMPHAKHPAASFFFPLMQGQWTTQPVQPSTQLHASYNSPTWPRFSTLTCHILALNPCTSHNPIQPHHTFQSSSGFSTLVKHPDAAATISCFGSLVLEGW